MSSVAPPPAQSALLLQASTHLLTLVSQLPVAQSLFCAQVAQRAAVPVGATQLHCGPFPPPALRSQVPPGQSALTVQPEAHLTPATEQLLEVHWLLAVQFEQAGWGAGVQPQVPRPPPLKLQTKPPQSDDERQPSVQVWLVVLQLTVARSPLTLQVPHSGTEPAGAQVQVGLLPPASPSTVQVWPGQSALVVQFWVQMPTVVSQKLLKQPALEPQVPQRAEPVAGVPHSQTPPLQALPLQTAALQVVPKPLMLQCPVTSQLPLWQSAFWAQVAQIAAAVGLQLQVWGPKPALQTAPAGQLALLVQASVQVWLLTSQFWLMQSALALQVAQTGPGQLQKPPVQVAPLQVADDAQVVVQAPALQCPLAHSESTVHTAHWVKPVLEQLHTSVAPPSGLASQVCPPHWEAVAQNPAQVPVAELHSPLAQSEFCWQAPQVVTEPAGLQSHRPGPPSASEVLQARAPELHWVAEEQALVHLPPTQFPLWQLAPTEQAPQSPAAPPDELLPEEVLAAPEELLPEEVLAAVDPEVVAPDDDEAELLLLAPEELVGLVVTPEVDDEEEARVEPPLEVEAEAEAEVEVDPEVEPECDPELPALPVAVPVEPWLPELPLAVLPCDPELEAAVLAEPLEL